MSNHTEKFMRTLPFLALILASLVSVACVSDKSIIKEHAVISVADGEKTKTIGMGKVVVKMPRGQVVGQLKAGFACFLIGKTVWRGGSRSNGDSEFPSIFYEELKRNNYNVVGDPTDLFGKAPRAEITVAGLITNIALDVCHPNATAYYTDETTGNAKASITVEWQVYSNLDKKLILRTTSTGEAERSFTDGDKEEAVYLAFSSAVQGLLADKRFHDAVAVQAKPSGNFGSLTDAEPTGSDSGSAAPRSSGSSAGSGLAVPVKAGQTRTIAEVQKAVVVLELQGHGSGVLIGDEGYILTNHHVVEGLDHMRVKFQNGDAVEGVVVKSDPVQDVALVKIDSPSVKGLPLRLDDLAPGTEVYAVGAPLGTENQGTVTRGVVSAYRRDPKGARWLQSDASITFGNSGGPLVDAQGRVVGLSTMGPEYKGIAYFAPIADGLRVLGVQTR